METLLRLWDIMLHEGMKIVFKLSIYLIKCVEKELLKSDFMEIVRTLKDVSERDIVKNPDILIKEVLKIKVSKKLLDKLAKKYDKINTGLTGSKWKREAKMKEKVPDKVQNNKKKGSNLKDTTRL